jgi:hypothetical protein
MDPRNIDWAPLTTLLVLPSGCISADERLSLLSLEQSVFEGQVWRLQRTLFEAVSSMPQGADPDQWAAHVAGHLGVDSSVVVHASTVLIELRARADHCDEQWVGRVRSTVVHGQDGLEFHEQQYTLQDSRTGAHLRGSAVFDREGCSPIGMARLQVESSASCWTLASNEAAVVGAPGVRHIDGFQIGHGPGLGLVREMLGLVLDPENVVPHDGSILLRGLIGAPTPERTMIQEFHRLDGDRVEVQSSGSRGDFLAVLDARTGVRLS